MIEIKVHDIHLPKILDIVREMKSNGYELGIDFDWEYKTPKYDAVSGHLIYNSHTIFTFYMESLASYFSLKYL